VSQDIRDIMISVDIDLELKHHWLGLWKLIVEEKTR